ncbi:MAG: hypothetical protein ACJ8E4_00300 [Sphingomicrobium sp.]
MNRRVLGAIGGMLGLAALAAWAIAGPDRKLGPRPPAERPALALLTSLPLMFGERFDLDSGGSPALSRLEQRYKVQPIGVADEASLHGRKLLLMAHPRAQPAEVLVELDRWVRGGGRLLLLADPKLDWPSERALGDMLRPPPAFADTGLLNHWGLDLSGAVSDGPASAGNGKLVVMTSAPGRLAGRRCELAGEGFVARCRIGRGQATVIADADFLNVDEESGQHNLDLLIDELGRLDSR